MWRRRARSWPETVSAFWDTSHGEAGLSGGTGTPSVARPQHAPQRRSAAAALRRACCQNRESCLEYAADRRRDRYSVRLPVAALRSARATLSSGPRAVTPRERPPTAWAPIWLTVRYSAPFSRTGTMSTASPSMTFLSPTMHTVVMRTRRFSSTSSAIWARAITVSPIRTGARKRMLWLT